MRDGCRGAADGRLGRFGMCRLAHMQDVSVVTSDHRRKAELRDRLLPRRTLFALADPARGAVDAARMPGPVDGLLDRGGPIVSHPHKPAAHRHAAYGAPGNGSGFRPFRHRPQDCIVRYPALPNNGVHPHHAECRRSGCAARAGHPDHLQRLGGRRRRPAQHRLHDRAARLSLPRPAADRRICAHRYHPVAIPERRDGLRRNPETRRLLPICCRGRPDTPDRRAAGSGRAPRRFRGLLGRSQFQHAQGARLPRGGHRRLHTRHPGLGRRLPGDSGIDQARTRPCPRRRLRLPGQRRRHGRVERGSGPCRPARRRRDPGRPSPGGPEGRCGGRRQGEG